MREEIARWLSDFYYDGENPAEGPKNGEVKADADRICITGGASQNLACVLQVFTDPIGTTVWMVAPCYFLACRIFEDAGLRCRAVGEGDGGIDLENLERELVESEREDGDLKVKERGYALFAVPGLEWTAKLLSRA